MADVLEIVVFMGVVVGLAALILFVVDLRTLRKHLSEEERKKIIDKRSSRWGKNWIRFYVGMAFIALFVHAFNIGGDESLKERIGFFILAAIIVLAYLFGRKDKPDNSDVP